MKATIEGGQLASRSKTPRQALDWMPFEIVPDESDERGFHPRQVFRRDPATGVATVAIHGYTPSPTPDDGYHVKAIVEIDQGSAVVTKLEIEPSRTILEDGRHRERRREEKQLSAINTSVLALIKFTDIFNRIAEVEEEYAVRLRGLLEENEIRARLEALSRRKPRKDPAIAAKHSEQALAAMAAGRGYQARLRDEWGIGLDGVKKRISRLRADRWLHREYGKPGETLVAWRAAHGTDDSEPSLDSEED